MRLLLKYLRIERKKGKERERQREKKKRDWIQYP